ncbi:hypothetical protein Plec18170_003836 [Paecilomyces lecythidis]
MLREGLRKLFGDGGTWRRMKYRARRLFRCPVESKPPRPPPSPPPRIPPPRPPRPPSLWSTDGFFEGASPVFSPELHPQRNSALNSEDKDTEIDYRALDEMLTFPPLDFTLDPVFPELVATEQAKKEIEAYHNGTHPALNGPWPWESLQQFSDILTACITTGMTKCEIGQFLEKMCYRRDKPLDGLVTVMVNEQDPYCDIGSYVLDCFGPRGLDNGPYYGDVEPGDEELKPAPPKTGAISMPYFDPPFEPKYRREYLWLRPWRFENNQRIDNGVDGGGKVVADGWALKRLPIEFPAARKIDRSNSLNHRVGEPAWPLGHLRRAISLRNPAIRPISQLSNNITLANGPEYNERSAWSDDSSDDGATAVIPRSWSFRHNRSLSWVSRRSKAFSDIGHNIHG